MQVVYEFCQSAQDQKVLQVAEAKFFTKIKDDARIEVLTYFPKQQQFMTYHKGIPSTRYWDAKEFTFLSL
jgi:hypothetical protein